MESIFTITCVVCGNEAVADKWHQRRKYCSKKCYDKNRNITNKDALSEQRRKYYQLNAEKIKERVKIWGLENKERRKLRDKQYAQKHRYHIRIRQRKWHEETSLQRKKLVMTHYGNGVAACVCCGESMLEFLTLDHINNDGAVFRKNNPKLFGIALYKWLLDNNLPSLGLQTYCLNCNLGKSLKKGICPHKLLNN